MSDFAELRTAIEAAFTRRFPKAYITVDPALHPGSHVRVGVSGPYDPGSLTVRVHRSTEEEATRDLAVAVGLRPDGSDPAEEVERLTAEIASLRGDVGGASVSLGIISDELDSTRDQLAAARDDVALARTRSREAAAIIDTLTRERDEARATIKAVRAIVDGLCHGEECPGEDDADACHCGLAEMQSALDGGAR